jgi:hypothetical protein
LAVARERVFRLARACRFCRESILPDSNCEGGAPGLSSIRRGLAAGCSVLRAGWLWSRCAPALRCGAARDIAGNRALREAQTGRSCGNCGWVQRWAERTRIAATSFRLRASVWERGFGTGRRHRFSACRSVARRSACQRTESRDRSHRGRGLVVRERGKPGPGALANREP